MSDLKPCPFCGGEARHYAPGPIEHHIECTNPKCYAVTHGWSTEAEAIAAWNSRAAMEFDNWFYLPKPKEPCVEVTETTHAWDGMKVKTDVFYRVREQAVIYWAKELDEHIIKRICEVWNSQAERTCRDVSVDSSKQFYCSECECTVDIPLLWGELNYCPNCGAKVVDA